MNMKKRGMEKHELSFSSYGKSIDETPDLDLPDEATLPVDLQVILDETYIHCMMAMLLCLNRDQRLVFILGEVFGVSDTIGSEITQFSKDNFRQKLSRARKRVYQFMQQKCGLIDSNNPCKCHNKVSAMINNRELDPEKLRFNTNYYKKIRSVCAVKSEKLDNLLEEKSRQLFREHPFQESPDFVESLQDILSSKEFDDIFSFNKN